MAPCYHSTSFDQRIQEIGSVSSESCGIPTTKESADGDINPGDKGDSGDSSNSSNGEGSLSSTHSTGGDSSDTLSPIGAGNSSKHQRGDTALTGGGEDGLSVNSSSTEGGNSLNSEMEALYKRRHEEGYDIFDPDYAHWLNQHHPAALVKYFTSPTVSNSKTSTLQSTPLSHPSDTVSTSSSLTSNCNTRSLQSTPLSDVTNKLGNSATFTSNPKSGTQLTTPNSDQSKKPTSSSAESIVSKFLGGVPVKTPSRPADSKSSGARVLTSAECHDSLVGRETREEKRKG